jgi:hypothetical protein
MGHLYRKIASEFWRQTAEASRENIVAAQSPMGKRGGCGRWPREELWKIDVYSTKNMDL